MAAFLRGRVINSIVHGYQQPVARALNIRLLSDKAVDWPSSEPPIPEYKSPEAIVTMLKLRTTVLHVRETIRSLLKFY